MPKVVNLSPRGDDVSAECVIIEKEQRRKNVQLNILMRVALDSNPADLSALAIDPAKFHALS